MQDEREERKSTLMAHTIFLAIFSPLATVGMMLAVMWSMSAAGMPRKEYGQDTSEQIHSHQISSENQVLIDGAGGEPTAHTPGVVGRKPSGDRSIDQDVYILTRLDGSNQRQLAQLVNDLALKELTRLIERKTNTSC